MDATPDGAPRDPVSGLGTGSVAKIGGEAIAAGCGFLTGLIVARSLGPAGKGILTTLSYTMVLFAWAAGVGLGEAAIISVARGERGVRFVSAVSTSAVLLTSAIATGGFLLLSIPQFIDQWAELDFPVLVTAAALPFTALAGVYIVLLDGQRRFIESSASRAVMGMVTVTATWLLVVVGGRSLSGAALAGLAGWITSWAILAYGLRASGASLRPQWDTTYVRSAVRLGAPIQASQLLMIAAGRIDVIVVNALQGNEAAGLYGVALTVGALGIYIPYSISAAAYGPVANLPEADVAPFVARLSRRSMLGSMVIAALLLIVIPVGTPLAFGSGFRDSVPPAMLLAVGATLWSPQWLLSRAAAARGDGTVLLRSFGLNVALLLALDVALVPTMGVVGAAIASVASSGAGAVVALEGVRRRHGIGWADALIPRMDDVSSIVARLRTR